MIDVSLKIDLLVFLTFQVFLSDLFFSFSNFFQSIYFNNLTMVRILSFSNKTYPINSIKSKIYIFTLAIFTLKVYD